MGREPEQKRPVMTPTQCAARYDIGRTKVYEECKHGILKDASVRWGRRILISSAAARRIFEGEEVE
ncbi:MAG TPA: hypothetical protein VFH61_17035 [Thermoleophilia bacterium]|nr:hypothetical protein [Thermoleophilia bacterium]